VRCRNIFLALSYDSQVLLNLQHQKSEQATFNISHATKQPLGKMDEINQPKNKHINVNTHTHTHSDIFTV